MLVTPSEAFRWVVFNVEDKTQGKARLTSYVREGKYYVTLYTSDDLPVLDPDKIYNEMDAVELALFNPQFIKYFPEDLWIPSVIGQVKDAVIEHYMNEKSTAKNTASAETVLTLSKEQQEILRYIESRTNKFGEQISPRRK